MREMNTYKILVGKPEGKRPLARPRHRWENNIKTDRKEIVLDGVNWIHLLLLLKWLCSPMRTFASLMDFSQLSLYLFFFTI
jgi:hypothetical protein